MSQDRENTDIEKGRPFPQNPDALPDDDQNTEGPVDSKSYGRSSRLNVGAEKTEADEYKSHGMPKTSGYSVDKKSKSEPSVSTPADIKEQSDRDDKPDYGF